MPMCTQQQAQVCFGCCHCSLMYMAAQKLPSCRLVLYSSETQATLRPLAALNNLRHPKSSAQHTAGESPQPTFRIDMDDANGEVYLLSYQPRLGGPSHKHVAHTDSTCTEPDLPAVAPAADAVAAWPLFANFNSGEQLQLEDSAHLYERTSQQGTAVAPRSNPAPELALHLAVYSVAEQRLVGRREFKDSHRLASLQDNAYAPMQSSPLPQPHRPWKHQVQACSVCVCHPTCTFCLGPRRFNGATGSHHLLGVTYLVRHGMPGMGSQCDNRQQLMTIYTMHSSLSNNITAQRCFSND